VAGLLVVFSLLFLTGCVTRPERLENPPPAPREFRAVWVATVANIDWPSKPGLPMAQQRAELTAILDRARALKLNAIILQVRPAADALYRSALEPWSEYLTGEQGRDPGYDPLAEWVAGAHRHGLELHAWFNPYRARHFAAKSPVAATHIAKRHPEAVKQYGEYLWMDPAEPAAVRQTLDVVRDVVRRYDIDGVHIDDYFYPYPIKAPAAANAGAPAPSDATGNLEFPDEPAWQRYVRGGGKLARADWRRQNVNALVEAMHREVHRVKPWVRFGVSPFGVGRPDRRPAGITGFSQYDQLYADVELWFERGWMDYLAPQLYWPIEQKAQAFDVLLNYWIKLNAAGRHVWPGLFTSSINDTPRSWTADQITRQVELTRTRPGATGHIHFSMVALQQDRKGVSALLRSRTYGEAALVPATPWLRSDKTREPDLVRRPDGRLEIRPRWGAEPAGYAVWKRHGLQWRFSVQPAAEPVVDLTTDPDFGPVHAVVVSAVDRLGRESPPAEWRIDLKTVAAR
jgi:uncharacterized lipoprotein YddW (UPF0748 family)